MTDLHANCVDADAYRKEIDRLTAERDDAKRRSLHAMNQRDEERRMKEGNITALNKACADLDAARAELAAANARCAELEAGIVKLRDGMHEFIRGNWPASPTPVEVYSALAALTPEGEETCVDG